MADNPSVFSGTQGTAIPVAADEIAGVQHQRVKVQHGTDGSATDVSSASPMPVADAAVLSAVDGLEASVDGLEGLLARSATATRTQVADSATNVTILAANASRLGATVFNDSTAVLYLGLGTTDVTTSNYTVQVDPRGYYEVPFGFTGALEGLWATDPGTGGAKVTELTA